VIFLTPAELLQRQHQVGAATRVHEASAQIAGMDESMLATLDLPTALGWLRGLQQQLAGAQEALFEAQRENAALRQALGGDGPP